MKYSKCPHCEYEFDEEEIWHDARKCEFPTENAGDISEFDCPSCSNRLHTTLATTHSWSFQDSDGLDF